MKGARTPIMATVQRYGFKDLNHPSYIPHLALERFPSIATNEMVQWNPFLTTPRIATTVAITTDLQIPVFFFL